MSDEELTEQVARKLYEWYEDGPHIPKDSPKFATWIAAAVLLIDMVHDQDNSDYDLGIARLNAKLRKQELDASLNVNRSVMKSESDLAAALQTIRLLLETSST